MKTIFISDMHGRDPSYLVRKERRENGIEQAVFLGDYDTPEVLRELRKIKIPKKFVVGNHELHYAYDLELMSPLMGKSWEEYVELWQKNPRELKFIEEAIKGRKDAGLILEDKLGKRKIVYCHGGIIDEGSPDSDAPGYVWQRMFDERTIVNTFAKMIEKKYWALFRGHDHSGTILGLNKYHNLTHPEGWKVKLENENRYIINIGAFYHGDYAILDSSKKTLEFKYDTEGIKMKGP